MYIACFLLFSQAMFVYNFADGDRKAGMHVLRIGEQSVSHGVSFCVGLIIGLSIVLAIILVITLAYADRLHAMPPQFKAVLPLFR